MSEDNKIILVRHYENYYCFDWLIKLNCLCEKCLQSYYIASPKFATETISSGHWYLGMSHFNSEELLLHLNTESNFDNCKLRISVRNNRKISCYSNEYEITLSYRAHGQYFQNFKFINFSLINKCVEFFIYERVLTLVVELIKSVPVIPTNMKNLEMALKNLQRNEELSDVTLLAGEREFRAHKAILAAQSSVFLAMFKHDVKETNENRVVIEDITEPVMEQVLDYIYGGTVEKENFGVLASEVLVAADKYNLQGLVRICEDAMISSLDVDNVLQMLTASDVYKLDSLKESALNFIVRNVKEVVETDEFKKFLNSSNHCLIKEIVLAISN